MIKTILNCVTSLDVKNWVVVVLSICWLVLIHFFVVPHGGKSGGAIEHFLWWGIFPVILYWGRNLWVRKW